MATGKAAGLKPSEMVEGGGLISDVDVTFAEVRFEMWDYNGTVPVANPAIKAKLVEVEGGAEFIQYWSAGQSKDWMASEDGKRLVSVGSGAGLNSGSNAGILITSIVNAGFPEDKIGDDISVFDGMKAHVIRQAAPKRNIQKAPRADGRVYEDTVLVVSKVLQLPWEKKGGAASGTTTTSGDISEKVTGIVLEVLGANNGTLPKQQLVTKVFQHAKSDSDRNKIVQMVHKDEFLKAGPWSYEGGVVTAG